MNLYPVASYLRHVFTARSTAGYGVHSPFMFDFLRSVVRVKTSAGILVSVEGLRHEMLHDDRIIYMMDLGTGVDRERKIRDIAGRDSLPVRYVSLLARIVHGMGYEVSASGRTGGTGSVENWQRGNAKRFKYCRRKGIILTIGQSTLYPANVPVPV